MIVPVFNAEKYLRQCLDSLLAQTAFGFEIIAVDDGSTDNSPAILAEYAAKDSRIKLITQTNAGAGAARNRGMEKAQGKYLVFLDADDFFEPEMLRRAYEVSVNTESDITVWHSDRYHEQTGSFQRADTINTMLLPESEPFAGTDVPRDLFGAFFGWPWDKMFRADFIRENGLRFQEQRTTNDLFFVYAALAKADRIVTMEDVLTHYRITDDGLSLSVTREKSWDCFYCALTALRDQLRDWGLYERFEQDHVNYSLHFSLWNLNSLKFTAFEKVFTALKNDWFRDLGIMGKDEDYFYDKNDYAQFKEILSCVPMDYFLTQNRVDPKRTRELNRLAELFVNKTEQTSREKGNGNESPAQVNFLAELIDREVESARLTHRTAALTKELEAVQKSTTWKLGSLLTKPAAALKNFINPPQS